MELKLNLLLVEFSLIFCGLLLQESAGLGLASFYVASLLLRIKGPNRFLLPKNDLALSPTSTPIGTERKRHGPFALAPNAESPLHHSSIRPHKNHHFPRKFNHIPKGPVIAPSPSHIHSSNGWISTRPLPLPAIPFHHINVPSPSPMISPMSSSIESKKTLPPLSSLALPPPPPHQGCASLKCTDPLTYTPPGSPCGCVWPMEVRLGFSSSLYTFFPLVSELAEEFAAAILLDRSQVRIMGADAADQQLEKTTVLINLIPLEDKFDAVDAFSIYTKFWKREVAIKTSVFGAYEVLYVQYPGLPPSPPSRPSNYATIDSQPYPGSGNDGGPLKPMGVDLPRRRKNDSSKNMVVIVILSSVTAFVVCMAFILLFLSKCGCCSCLYQRRDDLMSSNEKPSGGGKLMALRSRPSSTSVSFSSSLMAYTGTAKVFTSNDIERVTDSFNTSRILGEGGFGLVYGGILDDGRNVAVKVLKRDDQQGGREFLAEVEMLSRLHHRNLVKLIGICAEDHCRCLVYELVPNGSVESHLHGVDKEVAPLDWSARMKIALGAARGLAYLHEDSSPRVIHRDFKSSNILLEDDYTPKVSDFGLARAAMDEGNKHISTHVMGTFGYLAPEYAMTGHLLVKSDVYSYGVVLLELLTGRKPVDLSQPPGQENLVSWARPLLASNEGLEALIDPSLKPNTPFDNFSKVAAIASMCVQPEVSHRPFMGEVVQALKLVCNEIEETREPVSRSFSHEDLYMDLESKHNRIENDLLEDLEKCESSYNDGKMIALSGVDLKCSSAGFEGHESESFRRQFNSVPLNMGRKRNFWQRLRGMSKGSMSDHEYLSTL